MDRTAPHRPGPLSQLLEDTSGNTLVIVAAALLPLLALVGGGVDASRGYMAQARLQQACDAGVLAARKQLGSQTPNNLPGPVKTRGKRFFNMNFPDKIYGTSDRDFEMVMNSDYSISGIAKVTVPTAVMNVFGFTQIPLQVECEAQLNFANVDVMMVLDVTGSMRLTNPGDSVTRIDAMRNTIRSFYDDVDENKGSATRVRFGFLPYATNVNVGHILQDDWVVREWTYQSRTEPDEDARIITHSYSYDWTYLSGSVSGNIHESSYAATWVPPVADTGDGDEDTSKPGYWNCPNKPTDTKTFNFEDLWSTEEPWPGPPAGVKTTKRRKLIENGSTRWIDQKGSTCRIMRRDYSNFTQEFTEVKHPAYDFDYEYKPLSFDVSNWRNDSTGCIEERDTYEIGDYSKVDLTRALDLDIDLTPTADNRTKWRPMYPAKIYTRSIKGDGTGVPTKEEVKTKDNFVQTSTWWQSVCPAKAQKLKTMTKAELDQYLATFQPEGATYHDIGMIWGGRLLSPTGLFKAENANVAGSSETSRHMIFLTDGQTESWDIAYTPYGLEPLDARRWQQGSAFTLQETVEKRFLVACNEVKKRNITVWVIAFGTKLNDVMKECAGPGRHFEASDNAQLETAFDTIGRNLGDLRIER